MNKRKQYKSKISSKFYLELEKQRIYNSVKHSARRTYSLYNSMKFNNENYNYKYKKTFESHKTVSIYKQIIFDTLMSKFK